MNCVRTPTRRSQRRTTFAVNSGHYEAGYVKSFLVLHVQYLCGDAQRTLGHSPRLSPTEDAPSPGHDARSVQVTIRGVRGFKRGPIEICDAVGLISIAELALTRVLELSRRGRVDLRTVDP